MPLGTGRAGAVAAIGLVFGGVVVSGCAVDSSELVTVIVDTTMVGRPISPYIYGISASGGARPYFKEMGVSAVRWGGNARTRFNWETNASNAGADWEFRNLKKGDETPGSAALAFHRDNAGVDASSLLTVPMIGWVARDRDNDTRSLNVFDDARSMDGYQPTENRQRTSVASFARKPGEFEYPPDRADGAVYQDEWVHFLTQRLGTAEEGGVRFYEMDNEPMLWSQTHRDVHPWPVGYDDYVARFIDYAAAVKDVDPTAQVLGPSVWGWTAYFYAALDEGDDNYGTADDQRQHGNTPFLPWFLGKVREYDLGRGQRSLDYLSVHYYPQGGVFSDDVDDAAQARRLRSTRSLWDPTYKDESWISQTAQGPHVNLIGLLREWIDRHYPGTGLAITEWNWGGSDHISGGLASAEVLGIFGREGVDLATYWGVPTPGSPVYWAFRMFRNYDGEGHGFGDRHIEAESSRPGSVSAFASIATGEGQLRLLLINKSPEHEREVRLDLRGVDLEREASVYRYAGAVEGIQSLPPLRLEGEGMSYEVPPYSMTMLVADLLDQ